MAADIPSYRHEPLLLKSLGSPDSFSMCTNLQSSEKALSKFTASPQRNRKVRLMLVDDDPMVGRAIARNMMLKGPKFDIINCTSTDEALAALANSSVDVLITDLSMPQKDGSVLLKEVAARHPYVLRFALSGEAKPTVMMEASRLAHQYFSKPADSSLIKQAIVEMIAKLDEIQDPDVVKTLAKLEEMPSRQASLAEFLRLLTSPSSRVEEIVEGLKNDPALSARILKVANSPYFGRAGSIASLEDAVGLLGVDMITSMAATHKVFAAAPLAPGCHLNLDQLWEHCVHVSFLARRVGRYVGVPTETIREAATAALLHDIGKLVVAYARPMGFNTCLERAATERSPLWFAECAFFGNHHGDIGGCLLRLWGLPAGIVDAVSLHHTPHKGGEETANATTLVHIADALAHAEKGDGTAVLLDKAHLAALKLNEDLAHWRAELSDA
jgi:putative nucleotidyltransferase with HDIG domain